MKRVQRLLHGALVCVLVLSAAPSAHAGKAPADEPLPVARIANSDLLELALPPGRDAQYVPGEVIVKFKSGISTAAAGTAHGRAGGKRTEAFRVVRGLELASVASGRSVPAAIKAYEAMPEVEYAQPNYIKRTAAMPSDPRFAEQWGLHNTSQSGGLADADVDAPEAWDYATGTRDVVVAVLDSGVDYGHPDLAPNIWVNSGEVPGNGIDDDNNGYIDDVRGWDALNIDADPMDDNGHGTHVAGIVGAAGNNGSGVSGTAWSVSLMPVKTLGANGSGTTAGVLRALEYVRTSHANVVNCSWGGSYAFDAAERSAIQAVDKLFVFAAGNEGENNDTTTPYYPASYDLPNILAVGASTAGETRASFSNYGATTVDVFAPGEDILSTTLTPMAVASDAGVNPISSDAFSGLSDWEQFRFLKIAPDIYYPHEPLWALNSSAYTSAPRSAAVAGYVDDQMIQLRTKQVVDLSAADYPAMQFSYRSDLEPDYDFIVWGVFDVSAGKNTMLGYATGDTGGAFRTVVVDLRQFAGQPDVKPFFRLIADSDISSAEGYDGVWIDDVSVFDIDLGPSGVPFANSQDYSNAYGLMSGTSMATPYVTGIAALLLSRNASLTAVQLKDAILASAEQKPAYSGKCVTGARVNARAAIERTNRVPVAAADAYAVEENSALSVPAAGVLGNDSDPDGDTMTAAKVTGPANGTLTLNADGSFTYTPAPGYSGTDTFTYRASDGITTSSNTTVTITVSPVPVAVDDTYTAPSGRTLSVPARGLLTNDLHTNPSLLIVSGFDQPANGTVAVHTNGAFTYTSKSGFAGTDQFTYTVTDGTFSDTAIVRITVVAFARIHRFYNNRVGTHFYTSSDAEQQHVAATWPHIFTYEGIGYYTNTATDKVPLFRFYHRQNGSHFYTASETERNMVIAKWPDVYTYEGVAYQVSSAAAPGKTGIHRFYNRLNGSHFYTASDEEQAVVAARWPNIYIYEGIAFYVTQ